MNFWLGTLIGFAAGVWWTSRRAGRWYRERLAWLMEQRDAETRRVRAAQARDAEREAA